MSAHLNGAVSCRLYVEAIDVGEDEPRTIASGLKDFVSRESLKVRATSGAVLHDGSWLVLTACLPPHRSRPSDPGLSLQHARQEQNIAPNAQQHIRLCTARLGHDLDSL